MVRESRTSNTARGAALAPWMALVLLAFPMAAHAVDVSFKLEPGVAVPLTAPQSQVFGVGGGQTLKALFGLTSFLDIGPTVSFTFLPAKQESEASGCRRSDPDLGCGCSSTRTSFAPLCCALGALALARRRRGGSGGR